LRQGFVYALCALGGVLVALNVVIMLLVLPDEASQGAIYRILFFHVPAAWTALGGFLTAAVASAAYLIRRDLKWDALAVSVTEAGLAFGAANLISGMIWARVIWGIWWTWDPRLTSTLVCLLLYGAYLMLRGAVDEPGRRAGLSAVFSLFAFADVPIVWFSIHWWRTQHPQPVVSAGGSMDSSMWIVLFANWTPLLMLFVALVEIRLRQERMRLELDALRRQAHTL
jgi:heme exporter protein C